MVSQSTLQNMPQGRLDRYTDRQPYRKKDIQLLVANIIDPQVNLWSVSLQNMFQGRYDRQTDR